MMSDVTVVLAVRNGMPFLPDAVTSVLSQSHVQTRLLVVNDGSQDATGRYLSTIADNRVQMLSTAGVGLGAALNLALEQVDTPFFARMDADDICSPQRIERQLNVMKSSDSIGMVGTQLEFFASADGPRIRSPLPTEHGAIKSLLERGGHAISHPTLLARTNLLKQVGGYRVSGPGQDWDLFYRISEVAELANTSDVLYGMRVHASSTSHKGNLEVQIAKRWGLENAHRRKRGHAEVDFGLFREGILRNSRTRRSLQIATASARLYRNGVVSLLENRKVAGHLQVACAAILDPSKAVQRVRKQIAQLGRAEQH